MNLQREHAQGGQQGTGSREAQVNHVSQQLLFHSLTEKWTHNLSGFSGLLLGFFPPPVLDKRCRVKARSVPLPLSPLQKGFQLLFQPHQQQQSSWVRKTLPSLPQGFRLSMPRRNGSEPDQSTYSKSQRGSGSGSHTAEFTSLPEEVGACMYAHGWLRGPGTAALLAGPCKRHWYRSP